MSPEPPAPASEEELIALVREAAARGTPLHTVGNATKAHVGPATTAETISLRRLARVTAYEPGDLVVSVEAGARLVDLQRTLAARGQWLPLDPPHAEATIGGVLATNSHGPRRLGHGGSKDQLLGLRVLGADGVVTKSGGRVVKNVTGYDLHKLHVGAFGSLGIILEAHFKVRPRPEVSGVVLLGTADVAAAHRALLAIAGSALRPVALEAFDEAAAGALFGIAGVPAGALALVGVEGSAVVFERHVRELQGVSPARAVLRGPEAEAIWAALRDKPARPRDELTVRLGARPHDLPALLEPLRAQAARLQISAGLGVARIGLRRAPAADLAAQVHEWHARAAAVGGYAVVEAAPLDLDGRATLPWSVPGSGLGASLRQAWDPAGVLNPGRMAP